jgi:hypothetical protein
MLTTRQSHILTSIDNVKKWKMFLENSGYLDKSYIESDIYILNIHDVALCHACDIVYEKCKYIQRDQFILSWILNLYQINYEEITQKELIEYLDYHKTHTRIKRN